MLKAITNVFGYEHRKETIMKDFVCVKSVDVFEKGERYSLNQNDHPEELKEILKGWDGVELYKVPAEEEETCTGCYGTCLSGCGVDPNLGSCGKEGIIFKSA